MPRLRSPSCGEHTEIHIFKDYVILVLIKSQSYVPVAPCLDAPVALMFGSIAYQVVMAMAQVCRNAKAGILRKKPGEIDEQREMPRPVTTQWNCLHLYITDKFCLQKIRRKITNIFLTFYLASQQERRYMETKSWSLLLCNCLWLLLY